MVVAFLPACALRQQGEADVHQRSSEESTAEHEPGFGGEVYMAKLAELSGSPRCSHSEQVLVTWLTPMQASNVLGAVCQLIADPESMKDAWSPFKTSIGDDAEEARRAFEQIRELELVGLRKEGVSYIKGESLLLTAAFCPPGSKPQPPPGSNDCQRNPSAILEFVVDKDWRVTMFRVRPPRPIYYDVFSPPSEPYILSPDAKATGSDCGRESPIVADGVTASEADAILQKICALFASPSRPGGLKEIDLRELAELPRMQLVELRMLPVDVLPDTRVLVSAIYCPKPVRASVKIGELPCPGSYRMLDIAFQGRTDLEVLDFGYGGPSVE